MSTANDIIALTFLVTAGFVATTRFSNVENGTRRVPYWLVEVSYQFIGFLLIGSVIWCSKNCDFLWNATPAEAVVADLAAAADAVAAANAAGADTAVHCDEI